MKTKEITYQESISEIEQIVQKIESGELDVDQLAEHVKRAATLIKNCKDKLRKTETDVENILKEMAS